MKSVKANSSKLEEEEKHPPPPTEASKDGGVGEVSVAEVQRRMEALSECLEQQINENAKLRTLIEDSRGSGTGWRISITGVIQPLSPNRTNELFVIEVRRGGEGWTVYHPVSSFKMLHDYVSKAYHEASLVRFPEASGFWGGKNTREELELYMQTISAIPKIANSMELHAFLMRKFFNTDVPRSSTPLDNIGLDDLLKDFEIYEICAQMKEQLATFEIASEVEREICFVGNDAWNWMKQKLCLSDDDATKLGKILVQEKIIEPINTILHPNSIEEGTYKFLPLRNPQEIGNGAAFVYVIKEGILWMWSGMRWHETWAVLYNYFIYLYKSKDDVCPKGVLFLESRSIASTANKDKKKDCFQVSTQERNFYFSSRTTEEMSSWITSINSTIQKMRQNHRTNNQKLS